MSSVTAYMKFEYLVKLCVNKVKLLFKEFHTCSIVDCIYGKNLFAKTF